MSVSKEVFLIVGCDIKDCLTDRYKDWKWSEEGERYHCFQEEGEIQIIDDGMSGDYTYIGHIIAKIEDDYSNIQKEINVDAYNFYAPYVVNKIQYLANFIGVLDANKIKDLTINMVLFNHFY